MKAIIGSALATLLAVALVHAQLSAEEMQSADMRLYSPTAIEWKAAPAALPAGARMTVLEGDPTKEGPFVVRFQFPDGYHVPPHTHPKIERLTVISGTCISRLEKRSIAIARKNFRLAHSVTGPPA
jgi:quercetin dioxygenase-like cupin family protein